MTEKHLVKTDAESVQVTIHAYPTGFSAVFHGICLGAGLTLGVVGAAGVLSKFAHLIGAA